MKRNRRDDIKKPGESDKVGDLLKKLRELDQSQLEDVTGGMASSAGRGRCGSHCMNQC